MSINHIIFGEQTLIDLREDTVTADKLIAGYTAHAANGTIITGTMPDNEAINGTIDQKGTAYTIPPGYHNGSGSVSIAQSEQDKIIPENIKSGVSILGVEGSFAGNDTSDATASASDILSGQTAYINSGKTTGTMTNNGAVAGIIGSLSEHYIIPEGYHNGAGTVSIDSAEQAKLIAANIKAGVSILGVSGTLGLFSVLSPIAEDFVDGYVSSASGWTYQAGSNNRADIYQVTADHTYFCRLGDTVSERWRGCFTTANPVNTTGDLSGSCVVYQNENNVPKRACFAYKPRVNGYISIVKTRSGINGIPTFMFDITGFDLLLGGE